jgi:hypothetical protein
MKLPAFPSRTFLAGRLSSGTGLRHSLQVEEASRHFLMYFVVPAWLGAGLLDYLHHRRTCIERTAGTRESFIHGLMMAEASIPMMMGIFLDVDAGVLATAFAAVLAHEATAIWDVSYAEPRRRVVPAEQHVHSFLEVLPVIAASFLAVLHWNQARALVRAGDERPRWSLKWKQPPLPRRYVIGNLAALLLFGALPYL